MKLWSLYNKEEKLRIDDLSLAQVKVILLSISSQRMSEWYACPQGKMAWLPLEDVAEFKKELSEIQSAVTAVLPMKLAAGAEATVAIFTPSPLRPVLSEVPADDLKTGPTLKVDDLKTGPTFKVDVSFTKERRSARRFARRLRFQCIIHNQKFSCETIDVSMTGLSLSASLPPGTPKLFKAELIVLGERSLVIMCERVSAKKIKISDVDDWSRLRRWIATF